MSTQLNSQTTTFVDLTTEPQNNISPQIDYTGSEIIDEGDYLQLQEALYQQSSLSSPKEKTNIRDTPTKTKQNSPIKKDCSPYKVLKLLETKRAISRERIILRSLINETLKEDNVTKSLNDLYKKGLICGTKNGTKYDTFYISEEGLKALELCEEESTSSQLRTQAGVEITENQKDIVLSMFYLGATNSNYEVVRPAIMSKLMSFVGRSFNSRYNDGKFNHAHRNIDLLCDKRLVTNNKKKHTYFLSEEGVKKAKELIENGKFFKYNYNLYGIYQREMFEEVQNAILFTLYYHIVEFNEEGIIYPVIVNKVNCMVENIPKFDRNLTLEYVVLSKLVYTDYFVSVSMNKDEPHKYYLTTNGGIKLTTIDEAKIQKYMKALTKLKEEEKHEKESRKRPRNDSCDIVGSQSPKAKKAKLSQSPPRKSKWSKIIQGQTFITSFFSVEKSMEEEHMDVESLQQTECDVMETPIIAPQTDDNDNMNEPHQRYLERLKIDYQIAQKYPTLKMDQVFSLTSSLIEIGFPPKAVNVKLIIDTRENDKMRSKIKRKFDEEGLKYEERALYAGDYAWAATGDDGEEYLLNAIIERKTITDFDSSYNTDKYARQLTKINERGIDNKLYLIEGKVWNETSFNNVKFDDFQKQIESVHEKDNLTLIRTLTFKDTIAFLADITRSLENVIKTEKLTERFFAYPLRSVDGLKDRDILLELNDEC